MGSFAAFTCAGAVTPSVRRPRASSILSRHRHVRTLSIAQTCTPVLIHKHSRSSCHDDCRHRNTFANHCRNIYATAANSSSAIAGNNGDSNSINNMNNNGNGIITKNALGTTTLSVDTAILEALAGKRIVITGGTGMIGRELVSQLLQARAHITLLARNPTRARQLFTASGMSVLSYDASLDAPPSSSVRDAVIGADVVVNLAGEPIESGRWTSIRKQQLRNSRITGTRKLTAILKQSTNPVTFVSASAVGYYGASESVIFTEDARSGTDFLADLASEWESVALEAKHPGRTVVLRFGVVLSKTGGALNKMIPAFRAFLGGPPGSGRQWLSWVHIDDLVRLLLHTAVDQKWNGVYNATAPQPVRLAEFCKQLGRALGRPSWLPIPAQAVQLMLGGEAAQLVLAGQNVVPKRTRANGFVYKYKDVGSALQDLCGSNSAQLTQTP